MSGIKICVKGSGGSERLTFPIGAKEAGVALRKIGAENGAFVFSEIDAGFDGKLNAILAGADLDVVNYLAARLAQLSPAHIELLDAMLESSLRQDVLSTIERVIDFSYNTGTYEIYRGIHGPEDLARHYIYHSGLIQMPPEWAEGIDLVRFGKNLEKHEPGHYTKYGYLISTGLEWTPVFEKSGEVPSEYRIAP